MRINEEEYYTLEKVCVSGTAEFRRRKDLLFKYYYFLKRQTKDKLEYLMSKSYILGSGFSIEEKIKACIEQSKSIKWPPFLSINKLPLWISLKHIP